MNNFLAERREGVSNNNRGVEIVMILLAANLMALNTVFAQENKENDKSRSSAYTIAYSWSGINLTDNEGKSKNKIVTSGGYAAWSPDGKRIAFYAKYDERKTWSIHTMNSDGTDWKRLTHVKNKWDNSPTWSPDGTKIAFSREYEDSDKNWNEEIWIMNSDGSEQTQIKPIKGGGPYFTPDGRIVFHSAFKDKKSEISIADIDGNNINHLIDNEAEEQHPEVSPNGMQIAFMSDRDGNKEIYVMNIDGSNQKQLTSSEGAKWYPSWSPDGSKLIFSSTTIDGKRNVFMMNKDGSSVKKIISNGTQPAWLKIAENENSKGNDSPPDSYRDIQAAYFGEKSPGLIPTHFDPEIVSPEGLFEGGKFSPDMKSFYFTRKNGRYEKRAFFVIRYENGSWGNESETDIRWPNFTKDGNMIYGGKEYRERTEAGWSEPKRHGEFLKDQAHGISLSSTGTCYFAVYKKDWGTNGALYYSRFIDGNQQNPVKMNADINTGGYIAHPYIAPDESYLMWDAKKEDGYGQSDLYISFRAKDGSWLAAMSMGDKINTALSESSPRVTHDGKYLFFSRGEWEVKEDGSENWVGRPYWVDSQVIENLRPQE